MAIAVAPQMFEAKKAPAKSRGLVFIDIETTNPSESHHQQ
jgi:hypothetical protein